MDASAKESQMTQNNAFGAVWTEGEKKWSHGNVLEALCIMPNFKHLW